MKSPIKRRSPELADLIIGLTVVFLLGTTILTLTVPRQRYVEPFTPIASVDGNVIDEVELLEMGEDIDDGESDESSKGPYGALPPRTEWASKFRKARLHLLSEFPICQACGRGPEEAGAMNAHHVVSVKEIVEGGLHESLKWDHKNLITLCRPCHLHVGHHDNFSTSNPNVRRDAAKLFEGCQGRDYQSVVADWRADQPMAAELTKDSKSKTERRSNREKKTTVAP